MENVCFEENRVAGERYSESEIVHSERNGGMIRGNIVLCCIFAIKANG